MEIYKYLENMELQLKIRNYSVKTIKAYMNHIKCFLYFIMNNSKYSADDRIKYFLAQKKGASNINQANAAIKFFYKYVLDKPLPFVLEKVRKNKSIPRVYTSEQIYKILGSIRNKKHYLMIAMLYGSGLRISELVNIKIKDIDFKNLRVFIKRSKFNKDRLTLLSKKLVPDLKNIINKRSPGSYLFVNMNGGKYNVRTLHEILKKAENRAGLTVSYSCHALRHSFATHLLEAGVNIKSIKNFMGHKSIKTTMGYTHIAENLDSKIKSPL